MRINYEDTAGTEVTQRKLCAASVPAVWLFGMTISLNCGTAQLVVSAGFEHELSCCWKRCRKYCIRETSVVGFSCRPGSWS